MTWAFFFSFFFSLLFRWPEIKHQSRMTSFLRNQVPTIESHTSQDLVFFFFFFFCFPQRSTENLDTISASSAISLRGVVRSPRKWRVIISGRSGTDLSQKTYPWKFSFFGQPPPEGQKTHFLPPTLSRELEVRSGWNFTPRTNFVRCIRWHHRIFDSRNCWPGQLFDYDWVQQWPETKENVVTMTTGHMPTGRSHLGESETVSWPKDKAGWQSDRKKKKHKVSRPNIW